MFKAVTLALLRKWLRYQSQLSKVKKHVKRVLVEDPTYQKLPKSNQEFFPYYGNGQSVTAGMKADPIDGHTIVIHLHEANEEGHDPSKGLVDLVKKRPCPARPEPLQPR